MTKKNKKKYHKTFAKYFSVMLLALFITTTLIFFFLYRNDKKRNLLSIIDNEIKLINLQKEEFVFNLNSVISDLLFLSQQNELISLLENDTKVSHNKIAAEYINLATNKKIYDQIRYIDKKGKEIVRINFNNNSPKIVPENRLQSKKNRYYFENSISQKKGEVFISPFDLNLEKGEIEKPIKPMIRFGTPIFDSQNNKRGIVILNYLGKNIIEKIKNIGNTSFGNLQLLNQDSYWLNGNDPEKNWGFMYNERKNINFKKIFSEEWDEINNNKSGQLINDNGIFVYNTIYPFGIEKKIELNAGSKSQQNKTSFDNEKVYYWKIISHISPKKITVNIFDTFIKVYLIILIFVLIISYLLAKLFINQRISNDIKIELERKNSVLAMIVTANHEINQPLAVLKGNIHLFKKSIEKITLSDKQEKYMGKIYDSTEKINSILTNFRESKNIHFSDYSENIKMVSFDKEVD